ncbi:MAG: phosphotransferase [Alkalimonas sp.]|nr:phosphotransferase [Alkalimonas sp.]
MAQPLPATTTYQRARAAASLSVEQAEYRIRQLCLHLEFFSSHPPEAMAPLSHGTTNLSYWVKTSRGEYVVRHYSPDVTGVCRQQELRCQHAAAVAGLSPAPLCLNNHQQVLISEFLADGTELQLTDQRLPDMAKQLVALHRLGVQTPVLDPASYLSELKQHHHHGWSAQAQQVYRAVQQVIAEFMAMPADIVLTHLDLHPGNLLWQQQRIWLLDFEYAQLADSSLDLASLIESFQLTESQSQQLLRAYHQLRPSSQSLNWPAKLAAARVIYLAFCWLWYLALEDGAQAARQQYQLLQQALERCKAL